MNKIFQIIFVFVFLGCNPLEFKPSPKATKGYLDLSQYFVSSSEVIDLDGEWEFHWKKFLLTDGDEEYSQPIYANIPAVWNGEKIDQKKLPGYGYGSYRLKLRLPKHRMDSIALKTPDLSSAYKVWFNGKLVGGSGVISKTPEGFQPQFFVGIAYVSDVHEENEIVVEVSNFAYSKGGFWESMRIGTVKAIHDYREKRFGFDMFLTGSLLIMGIYHMGLFSLRRKDRSSLWLGLFCFIMIIRTLTTGERLLFSYFPNINFEFGLKLEFLTFYLATPTFAMFLHSLYPDEFKELAAKIIIAVSSIFVGISLFTFVNVYSRTAIPFQIFTIFALMYGVYSLILGTIRRKEGAFVALVGFIVLFSTILNDILYANEVINTFQLSPFGLFIFIFSQAFLLSVRFSKAFFSVELLSHDLSRTNVAYSRFVPKEFLSFLEKQNITDVMLGDQVQKDMTILFSDIRSFTSLSENMSPEENFNFINEYLRLMNPIIRKHNGFIDKYIGDAIMALFPVSSDDAVRAGIEMINSLKQFNTDRNSKGKMPINIGIGIHTGSLMLGTVGDSERMEGTVISDAVNFASRVEGLTKIYGCSIVASEKTLVSLDNPEEYNFRFLGKVEVKGKKDPAPIFEIFDPDEEEIKRKKIETKIHFELAINAFFKGEKDQSMVLFEEIFKKNPYDKAAFHYIQKCKLAQSFTAQEE
jgi:class 3 adenylate cyclase